MGLLLVDGLNTWLPKIMEVAGYSTGDALGLLPALNLGAVVGPFLGGALVTAGIAHPWGFYLFTLAAVLAVLALTFVPAHVTAPERQPAQRS
jgi:MFS family permease